MPPLLLIVLAAASLLIVFGAGIALVAGGSRGNVDKRLEQFVGVTDVVNVAEEIESDRGDDLADRLDSALSGRGFFAPTKERIAKADIKLRVTEYIGLVFLSAVGVGIATYLIMNRSFPLALIGALVGLQLPKYYISFSASKRMRAFDGQLSDTLNLWVNALRSGYSVLQGMEAIATELPPPISREFERVVQEVRLGLGLEEALANMYRRVPSEDLDLIITAVNIQREVGGNLAEILDTISFTIRERVRIKGEIRTLTAQGRISGWVVGLLPLGLSGVLYAINGEYMAQLWEKDKPWVLQPYLPCGWVVIGAGLFMMFLGMLAIRKIVNIEV
ncbi:MAG: type II secretion system F family protein [Chloroflexi bacterium]|nr:type II secretion system F family protein [Chloroflexota bacterium]